MARHYLPIRDGYHFEVGQGVSELSFEGHQSGINAISLVRRAPKPVRAEFGRKSVDADPPFLFLSFRGEGGRLFAPGGFDHETLYFSVFDFFTEYNRIDLEGLKILHPGRYAHERLLFLDDYFRLSLSKIIEAVFILLKEDNPSFLLSEQRLLYEFIRLYQKEMAYIGLRVPRGYAKGVLDPAFELLGRAEGKPSLEELSRACSLSKTTFISASKPPGIFSLLLPIPFRKSPSGSDTPRHRPSTGLSRGISGNRPARPGKRPREGRGRPRIEP